MSEVLKLILGIASTLLTGLIMFVVGKRSERQHQSLLIRAEMLKPIEEWLGGVEKMLQIVADSMAMISQDFPFPTTYSMEERRQAAQFMGEKSRVVLGILDAGSLKTRKTRKLADDLKIEIVALQYGMPAILDMDNQITEPAFSRSQDANAKLLATKQLWQELSVRVGLAYSLIAKIKTSFV